MIQLTRGWAAACAVAIAILFAAPSAHADDVVELSWSAPEGCASRTSVLSDVAGLVASPPSEPLYVQATVRRTASQSWSVTLTMTGAVEGKRSLEAGSCSAVAQAAAMIIALAVDPNAGAGAALEESASDSTDGGPDESSSESGAELSGAQPGQQIHALFHAGVVLEGALLPDFGWGVELGGGVRWRWLRADLSLGLVPQVSTSLPEAPDVGGQFLLGWVGIRGCAGHDFPVIGIHACAAFRPSLLRGKGTGASENSAGTAFVPALSGGALLRFPGTSRFGLELGAGVTVPLRQPDFVVKSSADLSEELLFEPELGASFQWSFYYRL